VRCNYVGSNSGGALIVTALRIHTDILFALLVTSWRYLTDWVTCCYELLLFFWPFIDERLLLNLFRISIHDHHISFSIT